MFNDFAAFCTIVFLIIVTVFCVVGTVKSIAYFNSPRIVETGPNKTFTWTSSDILTVHGTYSLKSYGYFQVIQGDRPKQAVYEEPTIGEENGLYWIRDYPMSGDYLVSGSATVFSVEAYSATATPTPASKIFNIFFGSIIGIVVWLFILAFIGKLIGVV